MKKCLNASVIMMLLLMVLSACSKSGNKSIGNAPEQYTCPMHPEIVKDEPGSCPICKMDLVLQHPAVAQSDTLAVLADVAEGISSDSVKTILPEKSFRMVEALASGQISYNADNYRVISSRINGRIEKLYLKYNFQPVKKGQKIMEIYSPEIASAEQELLFLKNNGETALLDAAKRKLLLLGLTAQQVNAVLRTGKVDYRLSVYSPYSGYLVEGDVFSSSRAASPPAVRPVSAESSSMGGMSSGNATTQVSSGAAMPDNSALSLREGQYVSVGQRLFNVVSDTDVWAEFFVSPQQAKDLKRGQLVHLKAQGRRDAATSARVKIIQPFYKEGTDYMLVRAVAENRNNRWKIGELVEVSFGSASEKGTWLPRTAVLSLGERFMVFAAEEGKFKPVYVDVKRSTGSFVDIGNSLPDTLRIAENAWFLTDSESFIKPEKL